MKNRSVILRLIAFMTVLYLLLSIVGAAFLGLSSKKNIYVAYEYGHIIHLDFRSWRVIFVIAVILLFAIIISAYGWIKRLSAKGLIIASCIMAGIMFISDRPCFHTHKKIIR